MSWFTAIQLILGNPSIGTTELGMKVGISRSTTVRSVARKIIAAMAKDNTSELLAGLDIHYAACPTTAPESGASPDKNEVSESEAIERSPESELSPVDIED
jgi:hypothetical protein